MGQATSELRLITHHPRKATQALQSLGHKKKRIEKTKEQRRTLEAQLQLSLVAVSQAYTYFITNTVCRATRSSGCDPQTFHCLRVCYQERCSFCCVFLLFLSRCLFLTNLQAQGCIAHHGSIYSRLARRERYAQLQRSQRSQAAQKAVQDRAAKSHGKEAEA